MRVLLVDPHFIEERNEYLEMVSGVLPSLGILSIAAVLRKEHEVSVLDCQFHNFKSASKTIQQYQADIVAIQATTPWIGPALRLASIAKTSGATVVLGGWHPAVEPMQSLSTGDVDAVILGEGEYTLLEVCTTLGSGKPLARVKGIAFLKEQELFHTEQRPAIADLNRLPMCAWDLVDVEQYFSPSISRKRRESIVLVASRGCPWRCSFCSQTMFGHSFRSRDSRLVVEEMRLLYEQYGKRDFTFYDDVFTYPRSRIEQFCRHLITEGMDISWCCETRADLLDRQLLRFMKKAGCYGIGFGVESGNDSVRERVNKQLRADTITRAAHLIREEGMRSKAYFMIGFPDETPSQVQDTIRLATTLPVDFQIIDFFYPLPGTDIYEEALRKGCLLGNESFNGFGRLPILNYVPDTLNVEFLKSTYHKAYRQIYWHPKRVARYLLSVRSGDDLKKALCATWQLWRTKS